MLAQVSTHTCLPSDTCSSDFMTCSVCFNIQSEGPYISALEH